MGRACKERVGLCRLNMRNSGVGVMCVCTILVAVMGCGCVCEDSLVSVSQHQPVEKPAERFTG